MEKLSNYVLSEYKKSNIHLSGTNQNLVKLFQMVGDKYIPLLKSGRVSSIEVYSSSEYPKTLIAAFDCHIGMYDVFMTGRIFYFEPVMELDPNITSTEFKSVYYAKAMDILKSANLIRNGFDYVYSTSESYPLPQGFMIKEIIH